MSIKMTKPYYWTCANSAGRRYRRYLNNKPSKFPMYLPQYGMTVYNNNQLDTILSNGILVGEFDNRLKGYNVIKEAVTDYNFALAGNDSFSKHDGVNKYPIYLEEYDVEVNCKKDIFTLFYRGERGNRVHNEAVIKESHEPKVHMVPSTTEEESNKLEKIFKVVIGVGVIIGIIVTIL